MGNARQLVASSAARLPETYEAMQRSIALCESVDECREWADKSAALASYHRQSKDTALMNQFIRIQARAIRRSGELLETIEPKQGLRTDRPTVGDQPKSRTDAAREAGMSPHQQKTAMKIARIPREEFEELVDAIKQIHLKGSQSNG